MEVPIGRGPSSAKFFERVRAVYLERARSEADRFRVIDANARRWTR